MNAHCTHGPKTVGAPSRGSVQYPSGPPAVRSTPSPGWLSAGRRPAPGSLSPKGVDPVDETWPQPRVPRGGPEPSRAQLLQGRAASDEPKSSLQPQGCHSLKPRDGTPVSKLGPLVRKQAGFPRPLATARHPSRPATRPPSRQGGGTAVGEGPEWSASPRPGERPGLRSYEVTQRRSLCKYYA